MRPLLLNWRGIRIHAYPALLFIGLSAGIIVGFRWGRGNGLDPLHLYVALITLVIPALVGSRLLYVACHWRHYRMHPSEIWARQQGGAALYGGLLLALACSWPVLRLLQVPFGAFWDAAAITILVGMTMTKIGCLLNGCCAGHESSGWLALRLPNLDGVWCRRVPSQLLECGVASLLLTAALSWKSRPFAGALFLSAMTGYATARLWLETTREQTERVAGVGVYTAISAVLIFCGLGSFGVWWIRS